MANKAYPISALAASIPKDVLGSVTCASIANNATTTVDLTDAMKLDAVVGLAVAATGSGAATWGYQVSAIGPQGETIPCTEVTVGSQNATLSAAAYNTPSWYAVEGASGYNLYRSTAATSPSTTGLIKRLGANDLTFDDTGVVIINATIPATDTSHLGRAAGFNHIWIVNDSSVDLYAHFPHGTSSTIAAAVANAHLTASPADATFTKRIPIKAGYFQEFAFTNGRQWVCLRAASGTATAKLIVS